MHITSAGQRDDAKVGAVNKADRFRELHRPGHPLLMPNPWDSGSAKLLESLGFEALATTSSGAAATLGRLDYSVSRDEALEGAAAIARAVDVPVSADLENCFDDPAETVRRAIDAGLAGCSIEDFSGDRDDPIYPLDVAVERVAAAAGAASTELVLTARAENYLHGRKDLDDTIARLKAYQDAGAHVLYAPGIKDPEDISRLVEAVERPVNVLARPGLPPISELAALGVSRVSVGGAFAFAALGATVQVANELREQGTYGYSELAAVGLRAAREAF
jgi:2-methylisocitrate lyase-like PEP mutase family enzyme